MSYLRASRVRVLLSEASSLTAREHVTVLGGAGIRIEAMSSEPIALCRWSRWMRRFHTCPPAARDPAGYLDAVRGVLAAGRFDAVLPTHEQAWLLAVAADRLPPGTPLALAPAESFARVQSKIEFAKLLDELGAPQPRWSIVPDGTGPGPGPGEMSYPYFLKTEFSTAGRGVRAVRTGQERDGLIGGLRADGGALMAQETAPGQYGQVQALFSRGRLFAAHTSVQAGTGAGGSAAARVSVDHPRARHWAAAVGEALFWHGGLTLDYFHTDGDPVFIECNPRTVEPANAAASGVNLPLLSVALAAGWRLPPMVVTRRLGTRTHGTLALLLGTTDRLSSRPRRAALEILRDAAARRGVFAGSAEVLTPVIADPPSLVPLLMISATLLAKPAAAAAITERTIAAYSVTPQAIARMEARAS